MGMARCKDCVHYEACSAFSKIISSAREVEKGCEYFKDSTNYVEVVRCKDCKHFIKKHIDRGYCGMEGSGGFPQTSWAITDFCSYGERRTDGK